MPAVTQAGKPRIDVSRYELSLGGRRVKLERQPMDLLILLAERRGQLVTRDEIVERLWGRDVFVDVDQSVNAAVRKIRAALKDDAASPKYLETVVGKGYRFIGEVDLAPAVPTPKLVSPGNAEPVVPRGVREGRPILLLVATLALVIAAVAILFWLRGSLFLRATPIRSIAVLPLANLSGDSQQDFFADGISDELTTDLAKISSLKVISRTSTLRYKSANKSLKEIARDLKVDAIVEGSVARSGNTVRITAQLINGSNDQHLWADSYERSLGDILEVQNSVALEIARQVRTHVTSEELERLQRRHPVNPSAYEAYLKGRFLQTTQSVNSLEEAEISFQSAINLDPQFAPAYAGLADTYSLLANYRAMDPSEAFPKAQAAARQALRLDPDSPEAHTALAYPEHHYTWEWGAAEQEYKTAISLSPSYATAHLRYAELLSTASRHDEAIFQIRQAIDLDPLSPLYRSNLGRFLYHAARYDEAIYELKATLAQDPTRLYAHLHLGMSYEAEGRYREAEQELERFTAGFGGKPGPSIAHFYAVTGQRNKARKIAHDLRIHAGDSDWFYTAAVYAGLGDKEEAFACLEKAYEKRDFYLVFLKVSPYFEPLQSDPRFASLSQRIGLP